MESQFTFLQRNQCKSQSRLFDQFYCNLRFHEGSDVQTVWRLSVAMQFQSTLPRRERRYKRRYRCGFIYFNPRSHEGSDAFSIVSVSSFALFQSTLPRRERLSYLGALASGFMISIHAPTKGATNKYCFYSTFNKFQSTLPRRERRRGCIRSGAHTTFNPRSHEGSDQTIKSLWLEPIQISIHAPTKGATMGLWLRWFSFAIFQSTLPQRERL